jgi:hypothetical protein
MDQEKQFTPTQTEQPVQTEQPIEAEQSWTSTEIETGIPVSAPPATIVVASQNEGTPKWFFPAFAIMVIAFIGMTVILLKTVMQRRLFSGSLPPALPTVTKGAAIPPTSMPTPTPQDAILGQFEALTTSDEIADLESDIKNTDFSVFEQTIATFDAQLGFTSSKR